MNSPCDSQAKLTQHHFFNKKSDVGFTLIELLVVIAIIGILSSIVLASLTSSRSSAADAAIKQNLISIRSQAEIYFNQNGYYATSNLPYCTSLGSMFRDDPTIQNAILSIQATNGNVSPTCHASPASWAMSVLLKGGGYWCVDYTGASRSVGQPLLSNIYACP